MCGDLPGEQSSFERYHSFLCVELFFSWHVYDAERGGGGGGGTVKHPGGWTPIEK